LDWETAAAAAEAAATVPWSVASTAPATSTTGREPPTAAEGATVVPESETLATFHFPGILIRIFTFDRRNVRAELTEFPQGYSFCAQIAAISCHRTFISGERGGQFSACMPVKFLP
jgi:hypothetical protein